MAPLPKCNPHVPHIVNGKPCEADAAAKYTWPTTGKESYICQGHLYWITNLAVNLGVHVTITVLSAVDPYETKNCPAEGCGKATMFTYLDRGEKVTPRYQKAFVCPEHGEFVAEKSEGEKDLSPETPGFSPTDTGAGSNPVIPSLPSEPQNGLTVSPVRPEHLPDCGMFDVEGKEHWLCQTGCPIAELWRPAAEAQVALKTSEQEWEKRLAGDEEYQRLHKEDPHGIGAATRLLWLKKCFDEGRTP